MTTMLEAALQYHKLGFWVLPISPTGKNPALDEWKSYTKKRPTEREIRQWWTENPNYRVGFITGRNAHICVLDIDIPEKLDHYLELFPTGLVARSGGGGYHLYYAYPPDVTEWIPNRFPADHVHFRGDNGIIVAPPSMHNSGKKYEWVTTDTPAPLPDQLLNIIMAKGKANGAVKEGHERQWVRQLLESGSEVGKRNIDGTRLAGYFKGKGLPKDIIFTLMMPWYEKIDHTDFNEDELRTIIGSVDKIEEEKPKAAPDSHIMGFMDFVAGDDDEITWMIDGWLPDATTALMVAPPGHFKTWIELAIAMSVSTGVKLFGRYEVKNPGRVLIIQQEDSRAILKQRMRTIYSQLLEDCSMAVAITKNGDAILRMGMDGIPVPMMDMFVSTHLMQFSDQTSMELLELLIDSMGYKIVFIDPLYMAAETDNYMAKAARDMGVLKKLRDKYGTSFFVLHHTKKTTDETTNRLDAWGSQFLNAWLETGFQIRTGPNQKTVKMQRHFKGEEAYPSEVMSFDIDTSARRFKVEVTSEEVRKTKEKITLVDSSGQDSSEKWMARKS